MMEYLHLFRAPLLYLNFLGPNLSPSSNLYRQDPNTHVLTPPPAPPLPPLVSTNDSVLIPLNLLFGYSKYDGVRMSIHGKYISYLAPYRGVQNVWIAEIDEIIQSKHGDGNFSEEIVGKPLTHETQRPVSDTMWLFNNNTLIYFIDQKGDENYQLVKVDVDTGVEEIIFGESGVQARILWASHLMPYHIVIGLNQRDPRFHDPYLVDLVTGKMQVIFVNNGFGRIYFDNQLNPRLGRQAAADAYDEYFTVKPGANANDTDAWKLYRRVSGLDAESTKPLNFDGTGNVLYWLDSSGRDTSALTQVQFDKPQTTTRILFADPKADVGDVVFDRQNYKAIAAAANYDIYQLTPLDTEFEDDLSILKSSAEGQMKIVDKTNDFSRALVAYTSDRLPVHYHIYNRTTKTLTPLFSTHPALEQYSMCRMYPRQIVTRDGHNQLCYLSIPMERDNHGVTDKPIPMVLVLNLGDGQWAGDMHNDLLDAVNWAVDNKIALKDKIAIMGASYGGYATLVGLTFTPEVFACGVDLVGPSSLETLLNSIPAYWAPSRVGMVNRIGGDPRDDIGAQLLRSRSPLHRVDQIRHPLLIGQGANDPRVKQQESEQIVKAMKKRNLPVSYVLFPDEGHGLAREENMIAFMSVAEHFLQQCLGGRAEPLLIPTTSSIKVIEEGNMPELIPYKGDRNTG